MLVWAQQQGRAVAGIAAAGGQALGIVQHEGLVLLRPVRRHLRAHGRGAQQHHLYRQLQARQDLKGRQGRRGDGVIQEDQQLKAATQVLQQPAGLPLMGHRRIVHRCAGPHPACMGCINRCAQG